MRGEKVPGSIVSYVPRYISIRLSTESIRLSSSDSAHSGRTDEPNSG